MIFHARPATRFVCVCLLLLSITFAANCQPVPVISLVRIDTLARTLANGHGEGRLGGISAIEYFNPDSILLISDHDGSSKNSFVFVMNTSRQLISARRFDSVKNAESVRFNAGTGQYYIAFESKNSTGVGYLENGEMKTMFSEKIPLPAITSNNRGIEGITFTANNNDLWIAFESGGTDCRDSFVPFYKMRREQTGYDRNNKQVFQYPINPCSCLIDQQFDGDLGNGVSEILAYKSDTTKLLVLERCYNKITPGTSSKLWLAAIPAKGDTIVKQLLFDFTDQRQLPEGYKTFRPDNLEGMCWGPENADGSSTLYIISDNNFNGSQRTQLIEMKIWVDDKTTRVSDK